MITRIHTLELSDMLRDAADKFDQRKIRGLFIVAIGEDTGEAGWGIDCEKMLPAELIGIVQLELQRMLLEELAEQEQSAH